LQKQCAEKRVLVQIIRKHGDLVETDAPPNDNAVLRVVQ
jgi:hypothetical protein